MAAVIVTGASGFLGQTLLEVAASTSSDATTVPIYSPRQGGIDLTHRDAVDKLRTTIRIADPQDAVVIHAAAAVAWDTPEGLLANTSMALNVATWARSADIGFCVFVSGVNVYPLRSLVDLNTRCEPMTMYGLGKWAGEQVWRVLLPRERTAVVRLAGIWGWQPRPTLFWNRLLLAAALGSPPELTPVVRRRLSRRNYISAHEASHCLLQVAEKRMTGLFLGAGRDTVDTQALVKALQQLPGSRLAVDWQDDGSADDVLYRPSAEFLPWLRSFPDELSTMWDNRPKWILQSL